MLIQDPDTGIPIAIVLRKDYPMDDDTTEFLTEPTETLQLAVHNRPQGHDIALHAHRQFSRYINHTMEGLFVQSGGPITCDLFRLTNDRHPVPKHLKTVKLEEGDVIHLMYGAHSFRWEGKARVVEFKQGPYISKDRDKKVFSQ